MYKETFTIRDLSFMALKINNYCFKSANRSMTLVKVALLMIIQVFHVNRNKQFECVKNTHNQFNIFSETSMSADCNWFGQV